MFSILVGSIIVFYFDPLFKMLTFSCIAVSNVNKIADDDSETVFTSLFKIKSQR